MTKRYDITPEKFVQAYAQCSSYEELSKKLNASRTLVFHRANSYRKKGVKLEKYFSLRLAFNKLDVDKLNALYKKTKKDSK